MLTITSKIFDIPIFSPCLNILTLVLPTLKQIIERANVLLKMYDILGFFSFLYLLHLMQEILLIYIFNKSITIFYTCNQSICFLSFSYLIIGNIQILFHQFFKLIGENELSKSVRLSLFNIKSINPIQKYPHIIE